jgi:hypothetical protein
MSVGENARVSDASGTYCPVGLSLGHSQRKPWPRFEPVWLAAKATPKTHNGNSHEEHCAADHAFTV